MATAAFWQRGEALDYPNSSGSKIAANTIVVVGTRVGVIGGDIENGSTGSIHMGGVWEMPKTGSSAISLGQTVYWDGSGITNVSTSNTEAGYAASAAAADATKIMVKLNG